MKMIILTIPRQKGQIDMLFTLAPMRGWAYNRLGATPRVSWMGLNILQ